jgi:hypothetical protein
MDLPTSYGTRLLSPFEWHWFSTDWMPIVDIYLIVILGTGLVFGQRRSRQRARGSRSTPVVASSFDARSRNAVIALVLMVVNYGVRAVAHDEALRHAPELFGPRLPQRCATAPPPATGILRWPSNLPPADGAAPCLIDLAGIPTFLSPLRWRLIAYRSDGYEVRDLDLLGMLRQGMGDVNDVPRVAITYPNRWTPAVFAAADTNVARIFLGFARFPAVRSVVLRDGATSVQWTDLRFVNDIRERPGVRERAFFTATVRLDPAYSVLEQRLGP